MDKTKTVVYRKKQWNYYRTGTRYTFRAVFAHDVYTFWSIQLLLGSTSFMSKLNRIRARIRRISA